MLCDGAGRARPLSVDHKPAAPAEAARIRAAGGFVSSFGGVARVNGNLSLSRAIGDLQYKGNDSLGRHEQVVTVRKFGRVFFFTFFFPFFFSTSRNHETQLTFFSLSFLLSFPQTQAEPDVTKTELSAGDSFLLLACDGIWDVLTNQGAADVILEGAEAGKSPAEAAAALLDACLSPDPRATRGAGCDNMTAAVVLLPTRAKAGEGGGGGAVTGAAEAKKGGGRVKKSIFSLHFFFLFLFFFFQTSCLFCVWFPFAI